MTTKQQERKALERIKAIVSELGEDSYIGTAFAGCFEVAESNIENDWACSMKQRAEAAEKKQTELEAKIENLSRGLLTAEDLTDCRTLADNAACEAEREMKAAALEIVTFAEDPSGANFQKAVRVHRNAQSRWSYLLGLRSHIDQAMAKK